MTFQKLVVKILFLLFSFSAGFSQVDKHPSLLPYPKSILLEKDYFILQPELSIFSTDSAIKKQANFFSNKLSYKAKNKGNRIKIKFNSVSLPDDKHCQLLLRRKKNSTYSKEFYSLEISSTQIVIESSDDVGIFYALTSLSQLIESAEDGKLNCMKIVDEPQFQWRGMHLDVCRHFFSVDEVKTYINYLSSYKINTFHWHLTDDQGWRIEIKKYPQLCSIGSIRSGTMIGPYSNQRFDSIEYKGFYTQDQIKEIVAFAKERHVTVVPEIEMPGHALAALSAYPQFSCTKGNFRVAKGWGVFDDVFCAGNDSTFIFLENILSEVASLFPGKYIHIGGDECPKTRWKACTNCQARIKNENLKDEHELQSYFIQRIEKHLTKLGKQIIGWDEILEGGLAPHAAVMSWRGESGGIDAAKQNHEVVMCPGKPCYFDHYQSTPIENEPLSIGGLNTLKDVYDYYPVPNELEKDKVRFILGSQGNVWTEYILNAAHLEYMSMPRMIALSEALWLPKEKKNYFDFINRLRTHSIYLDRMKVNYCPDFKNKK